MKFKKLLLVTVLFSLKGFAGTTLPYLGPKAATCDVKVPQVLKNIDSGYVADENCKIVYVLPPVRGDFNFSGITKLWDLKFCPVIDKILSKMDSISNMEEVARLRAQLDKIAGTKTVSSVAVSAQLPWQKLIEEYRNLNPDKTVVQMPIIVGVFSTDLYKKSENFFDTQTQSIVNAVTGLRVHGFQLPEDYEETQNMEFPDYLKQLTTGDNSINVLMGQAIGMTLDLNLNGACAFLAESSYDLAGTYTYFYPVQDNALIKVDWNDTVLENAIMEIASRRKGNVTADELQQALKKKPNAVTVSTNAGTFNNSSGLEKLEAEYHDSLINLALENILSAVSSGMHTVIDSSKYTETETRTSTSCKRRWYGKKKCHTSVYKVQVTKIDWASVRLKLKVLLSEKNTGAEAADYKTYYMMGTSAMLPVSKQ